MTETVVYRLTTAVLFTIAAGLGAAFGSPLAVYIVVVTWLFWLTMTDATREQVATLRRRTIVALARLRKRHDDELLEVWCAAKGKPVEEYAPEGVWTPAAKEQPDVFVVDPEPATDEIPVCPPTQPDMKAAASVGPLPSLTSAPLTHDEWQAEQDAIYEAAMAKIRGGL